MPTPEPLREEHPQYLVTFREPGMPGVTALAEVIRAPRVRGGEAAVGVGEGHGPVVLTQHLGVHARVYTRLAVAATNLSPAERRALQAHPAVSGVYLNERRRLPPFLRHGPEGAGDEARARELAPPAGDDPRRAYLRGMRDLLDLLLREDDAGTVPRMRDLGFRERREALQTPGAGAAGLEQALRQIGVLPDAAPNGGENVRVAVLDTGADLTHPDLKIAAGNSRSFVEGEPDAQDGNGHGTHCAGVIAGAAQPQGVPRYGVAPGATLLIGKVLNQRGEGFDDQILEGLAWAVGLGASVVSLSLGSRRANGEPYSGVYEDLAQNLLDQDVLLIAAAGNDSARPRLVAPVGNPAACPSVLAVAAVNQWDQVAPFSCGDTDGIGAVDLSAPGVGILSAVPGGYERFSGTSMATPHVAGIAALVKAGRPELSARELWAELVRTARPVSGRREDVGAGAIQAPSSH